ncbi:branched-chain amino acid ABC transporter ATP-binding protein [Archaeoglobus veneficus]|uniref:Phosphate-transporting ATPase n=1 Tax=Archaeoglobus veneficus (strain DSM 11195 / SNP6) TaxID=693661 RepID=F2KRZ4_ARCVS|nr:ABC transporter ATP-binding protein [Archaeoglobus veneficus]AEA46835.1 Phosphate-transporting ATPase [Archaeoglobus veneficus SNP6]
MLRTEKLNAGYRELHILFDVDATIEDNKITTVVGPNGSGKSTFLKSVFGLTTVYSGKVLFRSEDITKVPPHQRTKKGIAYLPQIDNVFANLTVEENLKIAGYTLEKNELKDRIDLALDVFPELNKYLKKRAGALSGGERQFLAIATALVRKAELLMLDEPTAQLSPKMAGIIFDKIVELRDRLGLTILLVEQNVTGALEISDNAYLLASGRVIFSGKAEELLEHEKFEELCMGVGIEA